MLLKIKWWSLSDVALKDLAVQMRSGDVRTLVSALDLGSGKAEK
jgi:hypothetical protein